jgi:hypothetical protein
MATVEFWIQIENNPSDVAPRNIDRLTGQTMQQITGQAPVLKTLIFTSDRSCQNPHNVQALEPGRTHSAALYPELGCAGRPEGEPVGPQRTRPHRQRDKGDDPRRGHRVRCRRQSDRPFPEPRHPIGKSAAGPHSQPAPTWLRLRADLGCRNVW